MNLKRLAFITGDVHHSPDFIKRIYYREVTVHPNCELKASLEYAKILSEFEVPCTLFITGKALDMSRNVVKRIVRLGNVEIGTHTYYAFRGPFYGYTALIPLYTKIFGTPYGPKLLMRHDVLRAIHAFKRLGLEIKVWRTHGYHSNEYLYRLLARLGFKVVSDCKSDEFKIFQHYGLIHACINMPIDDNISRLSQHKRFEWYKRYHEILNIKTERGEPLVLQLHPANMVLDNFDFLMSIVKRLKIAGYKFFKLSNVLYLSPCCL